MSINVTVNGNHLNIRRGRMVLSDLDQIKKNERDRRRRLRLEQVRQQSKVISDKILERAKNIAKEELKKLENNDKLNLKQIHNGKIMEVQQKYQEDMADIGQAHISATLEPDYNAIIQEKDKRNKLAALKRGKDAIKQVKNAQQKETVQHQHEERLRQVRDIENLRSSMIAKLQQTLPETDKVYTPAQKESDQETKEHKSTKKKQKKVISKKSPGKITKSYVKVIRSDLKTHSPQLKSKTKVSEIKDDSGNMDQQSKTSSDVTPLVVQTICTTESETNNTEHGTEEVSNVLIKNNKTRYNPEDYVQMTSNSTNSDSVSSFSDDSSYFSDNNEQHAKLKTPIYVKCPATDKVKLYDHSKRQSNVYDKPIGVVEKIHTWNEPSATDLAQEIEQAETAETHLSKSRKHNAQKRGEDAALREKVRRDYQILMQNLNFLASEERKLKACQIERYPKGTYTPERRRVLRDQHKKKLNYALKTLLNEEPIDHSYPMKTQVTLQPRETDKRVEVHGSWEDPCCSKREDTETVSQTKCKNDEESREEQILDMLKKVERQKRLLLQEFGVDLPNNIFNASIKPLFEKEKSVQTESEDTHVPTPLSPEIRVISVPDDQSDKKSRTEEKNDALVKKVEIAVQTTAGDKHNVVEDKGTQVELIQEEKNKLKPGDDETETVIKHYPLEPKITVITHETDNDSSSSAITNAVNDVDKQSSKTTHKKTKRTVKTLKRAPSKMYQKSSPMRILQKYEDLQTTCAERIISLTNLIEKVRNEQKGMEFSIMTGDETSFMQLPSPKLVTNDLQSVRQLVENIEAIHNQLAKTLLESQRIIKNKSVIEKEINETKEMEVVTVDNGNLSKKVTRSVETKGVLKSKAKPKIIREEKVNIQLDRFNFQHEPQKLMMSTPKHDARLIPKYSEEEMIEKLSKEILEQSKSFNNNVIAMKEAESPKEKHSIETSTDVTDTKDGAMNKKNDAVTTKYPTKEQKKNKDFIPILTDIPKVTRTIDAVSSTNGRSKPPVSLLSGPYRTELESSGHELSTIIEFDTPDTINKSQNNIRSPPSVKKIAEIQTAKCDNAIKPPEDVLLFNLRNQHLDEMCNPSTTQSSMITAQKVQKSEMFFDSIKMSQSDKGKNMENGIQEINIKKLQYNIANQESLQMEESTGTDLPVKQYTNKDKITSTSSNSFSELSGISQIASTPSSTILKYASSPEEMETALKKLGLGWAITTLKKTREASALSSSSNSDVTPINTAKRISPVKKQFDNKYGLPDISDVSSISIKEASKSTEQAVLLKGRTSTPKLQNSNSNSIGTNSSNTNISENFQEINNGLTIPNISLTKTKSNIKPSENL
nr:PREDICTED: uncharacterized protein LOC100876209 isoform X4 [Megachile rotundata]